MIEGEIGRERERQMYICVLYYDYICIIFIYTIHRQEMQLLDMVLVCCAARTFVAFEHEGSSQDVHATKQANIYIYI